MDDHKEDMGKKEGEVKIFGKEHCDFCERAKQKMNLLGIPYKFFLIENLNQLHEGWREDESTDIIAAYTDYNSLPIIKVNGKYLDYPSAMKELKGGFKAN